MKVRTPLAFGYEVITGAAIALSLLTSYRSASGLGVGEVGLCIAIAVGVLRAIGYKRFQYNDDTWKMAAIGFGYIVLLLLPVTLIGIWVQTPGSSLRDWVAYVLSFGLIASLRIGRADAASVGKALLVTLAIVLFYQYFRGGSSAWYWDRFTGGANNPNQLALFCACAGLLAVISFRSVLLRGFFVGYFFVFGMLAMSDAYHAALAVVLVTAAMTRLVPRRYVMAIGVPLVFMGVAFFLVYGNYVDQFAGAEWTGADQGESRLTLFANGISAWLSTPFTFLLGNGAGNFSGVFGPFEMREAHDTPIDLLTIGGIIGLCVFYWYPLRLAFRIYSGGRGIFLAFFCGLLVFSLFHFVARHPVWWFTIFAASWTFERTRAERREIG